MGTRAQALWHPVHVVSVQEVAVVATLAQPAQPVLADDLPSPGIGAAAGHASAALSRRLVDAEHLVQVEHLLRIELRLQHRALARACTCAPRRAATCTRPRCAGPPRGTMSAPSASRARRSGIGAAPMPLSRWRPRCTWALLHAAGFFLLDAGGGWPDATDGSWRFAALILLVAALYARASFTDPGYVETQPRRAVDEGLKESLLLARGCMHCGALQRARTKPSDAPPHLASSVRA